MPYTLSPCPTWCKYTPGHDYDTEQRNPEAPDAAPVLMRFHSAPMLGTVDRGDWELPVDVGLWAADYQAPGGSVCEPVRVAVYGFQDSYTLTPDQAREVAQLLLDAADVADAAEQP